MNSQRDMKLHKKIAGYWNRTADTAGELGGVSSDVFGRDVKMPYRLLRTTAAALLILIVLSTWSGCSDFIRDLDEVAISFEAAGGETVDPIIHFRGDRLTESDLPKTQRKGYVFSGWYTDKDYEKEFDRLEIEPNEKITLYAKWTEKEAGYQVEETVPNASFVSSVMFRAAPAASFPKGINDEEVGSVDSDFLISETEVTYELWYEVISWAENKGYDFENSGQEGSEGTAGDEPTDEGKNQPVTCISWRDSIVWLNALSEKLGYDSVYVCSDSGNPIKDATDDNAEVCDNAVQEDADGFRLPASDEWELAARYLGREDPGNLEDDAILKDDWYWTPGDYASGASADADTPAAVEETSWYGQNSDETHPVKGKVDNALGLYDVSGNVSEWTFTTDSDDSCIYRGGSWNSGKDNLRIGCDTSSFSPGTSNPRTGFRIVRTAPSD